MASPKFLVFKLKDLTIPALILLIVIALFVFLMFKSKTTQTFAPSADYQDGKYIAGISLSDANMDLVVDVQDSNIVAVSLSGLDETTSTLYEDLVSSIDYVNTYVTATQSLTLPENGRNTPGTMLLMDAVKVALSDDANASLSTTYEKVDLTPSESASSEVSSSAANGISLDNTDDYSLNDTDDIFVDEFEDFDTETDTASGN